MNLKINLIVVSSMELIFLGACSNNTHSISTNSQDTSPAQITTQTSPSTSVENAEKTNHPNQSQGGQVIESGSYHLEFISKPENDGTHMDFYLQKGDNHAAIPNAKVTAQVQLPDGTQKSLPLTYDAEGKHYTALLPGKASGAYNVAILSDISGEKVNGRFTFNR